MEARLLIMFLAACSAAPDPRLISYEDLMVTADQYSEPGVTSFHTLLFDISRNQILVGARDSIVRLSVMGLERVERASWVAPPDKVQLCQDKGQPEYHCHNYIKVLLTNGKKLFTCGTNAFSPQCSWREMEEVSRVTEWVSGVGRCPYSREANMTALLSLETGQYFAGSPMDFSGADAAITRDKPYLRTNQYNSKWLNEPQFVGSFETDQFVYFLFRESAVEYINCGKIIYSRIARVCKSDPGGQLMLRDNWTSFVKARLNCSLPGEYPFYYDSIQGVTYLPEQGLLYATFTTPLNSIAGSAICSFNASAIAAAFSGAFKHQASVGSAWERQGSARSSPACPAASSSSSHHALLDSSLYQLMDSAVQPTSLRPLYTTQLETLLHIAVDVIPTKLHKAVHVIFVSTSEGLIKKISVIARTQETCVLEVWKPFPADVPIPRIHTLKFAMDSVYIGTEESVMRIPREHCARHQGRAACINSMDPYCGWHDHKEACTTETNPLAPHWHHDATHCPVLNHPVDGGWSAWSAWSACPQVGDGSEGGGCLCSVRTCDNPAPRHGGTPCSTSEPTVRVTNCTLHGGWSLWSGWSACSQSCGMAVKTRRRTCGNPAPRHGGRVCVGTDRQEMYCHSHPPCPAVSSPVRDGGWGSWTSWGECSALCGPGYRVRSRLCNNPPPHGGAECPGCHLDYQPCDTGPCVDSKRLSSWTPWTAASNGSEKRFRFSCRAPVPDPSQIKLALAKVEDRICTKDGVCARSDRGEGEEAWSEWSAWSPCSAECGEGQQHRARTCEGRLTDCPGPSTVSRICNARSCKGEWGCWTDWSECSASCGAGLRERARVCLMSGQGADTCLGDPVQHEPCHMPSCDSLLGWDSWTSWSPCDDEEGRQYRSRLCLIVHPGPDRCQGNDKEHRPCTHSASVVGDIGGDGGVSISVALWISGAAMVLGGCAGAAAWALYSARKSHSRLPSSPHYISSKQNPYVTVPLKESRPTPKIFLDDAPPATLKRNSHANGHRPDIEQDKFF